MLGPFEVLAELEGYEEDSGAFRSITTPEKSSPQKNTQFNNETLRNVVQTFLKSNDDSIKECQQELQKISREKYGKLGYILELLPGPQEQYSFEDPGNSVALLYV